MGLRPYSARLISQAVWIVGLIAFYIVINMDIFILELWQKAVVYVVILALLGLYWMVAKKKLDDDRKQAEGAK